MSRELLLVPKAKYESMLKLLGEENQQSVITEHSQEGGQIDKKKTQTHFRIQCRQKPTVNPRTLCRQLPLKHLRNST